MAIPKIKSGTGYASQVKSAKVKVSAGAKLPSAANDNNPHWSYPRYQAANVNSKKIAADNDNGAAKIEANAEDVLSIAFKARATWAVILATWWAVPLHIIFGFTALAGAGGELSLENTWLGIGAYFFPGKELFGASYAVILLIGIICMPTAAIIYTLNGVKWMEGGKFITFLLCSAAYFVPLPIPWLYLWLPYVVLSKD